MNGIGKIFKRFVIMLQFLTSIPIHADMKGMDEDYGKGLVFAPLVGFIIGALMIIPLLILYSLFHLRSPAVYAAITVVCYILISGGLHLDGLGDTFDGVFSNRDRGRMLEIMRDSRVGTNAVLAINCVLLLDFSFFFYSFAELTFAQAIKLILIFPVCGRIGSLISAGLSTYARIGEGLGKSFIDHCSSREMLTGFILYTICFYPLWGIRGLVFSLFPVLSAVGLTKWLNRKLKGMTGDMLGAVCELNQTASLAIFVICLKMFSF